MEGGGNNKLYHIMFTLNLTELLEVVIGKKSPVNTLFKISFGTTL